MVESLCVKCEYKPICRTGQTQPRANTVITGCSRFEGKTPITNADRIRAMSVEELAEILDNGCRVLHEKCPNEAWDGSTEPVIACRDCWMAWLNQEVSDGGAD